MRQHRATVQTATARPRRNGCASGGATPGSASRAASRYADARARRFTRAARQVAAAGRAPDDHRCAGAAAVVPPPRCLARFLINVSLSAAAARRAARRIAVNIAKLPELLRR
jgi:hypothetical protein